ncbi:MAG: GMC family oxidoreductase [Planctomycetes bacterium]|nr:GMC family oxidoreductase [Planctomycetota bacterium]
MTRFRLARPSLLASLLILVGCSAPLAPQAAPRATHEALFETFFPTSDPGLSEAERAGARQLRAASFEPLSRNPSFATSLALLGAPGSAFGDPSPESALGRLAGVGFAGLTPIEREAAVAALFEHSDPTARALVRRVRSTYLGLVYGSALGPLLVGDPEFAPQPQAEVVVPSLELQASQLRYDAETGLLTHREGPIEFLIVGSGPAGSVLANRLTLAGRRVLLVERGPFVIPGAVDTRSRGALMELRNRRTSLDGGIAIRNGSVVGGGSTVNIDLAFDPTQPRLMARIQGWVKEGRLDAARYSPARFAAAYAWVRARMGTRALSIDEINPNNRILWDGALARDVKPQLYALNRYRPATSPTLVDNKISAVRGLLLEALAHKRALSLLPDAEVMRVLLEGERAVGVEVRTRRPWDHPAVKADPNGLGLASGTTIRIRAQTVVLCAGTLGSPTILLRSGIAGPAVGRGVVIHPSVPLVGEFERRIDASKGLTASVYVDAFAGQRGFLFESMPGLPAYVAMMTPGSGRDVLRCMRSYRRLAGFGVMLVDTAHPKNRVRLDGEGRAVIDYTLRGRDPQRFRAGVAEGVRLMFAAGARRVIVPSNEEGIPTVLEDPLQAALIEEHLKFVSCRTVVTSAHMQGSLKLSSNPREGALTPDYRVWGPTPGKPYEGLYVVDGSVFPTSVGANPMQAIYTFARIAADQLGAR